MNIIDQTLGSYQQALQVKSRRLELISQNIANSDTPNFKARDIDFKALLGQAQDSTANLLATQPGHIDAVDYPGESGVKYRIPLNTSFDGNTVETSVEQAQYGQAANQYQATLTFLENRISNLRRALKGE
jgi:flagellar basal-body rod protein FlgB